MLKRVYFVIVVDELLRRIGKRSSRPRPDPILLTDPGFACDGVLRWMFIVPPRIYTGTSEKCDQRYVQKPFHFCRYQRLLGALAFAGREARVFDGMADRVITATKRMNSESS